MIDPDRKESCREEVAINRRAACICIEAERAAAAWVKVGASHTKEHGYRYAYVDPSSIRKSGNMPAIAGYAGL